MNEQTVMTIWPSTSVYPAGRALGQIYAIETPNIYFFRLGRLLALLLSPISVVLYFMRVFYFIGIRYRLTNCRLIVQRGVSGSDSESLELDAFDSIRTEVLPGQQWYRAADLVFLKDDKEVFRLGGVSRPDGFRQQCLNARHSMVTIAAAHAAESA